MQYSVEAYLRRMPTEKLENFLQSYRNGDLQKDFSNAVEAVILELARRQETAEENAAP